MKKTDTAISLSPFYQQLFVGVAVVGWLVRLAFGLLEILPRASFASAYFWLFQFGVSGMPVAFLLLACFLLRRRYAARKLLFMSTLFLFFLVFVHANILPYNRIRPPLLSDMLVSLSLAAGACSSIAPKTSTSLDNVKPSSAPSLASNSFVTGVSGNCCTQRQGGYVAVCVDEL